MTTGVRDNMPKVRQPKVKPRKLQMPPPRKKAVASQHFVDVAGSTILPPWHCPMT